MSNCIEFFRRYLYVCVSKNSTGGLLLICFCRIKFITKEFIGVSVEITNGSYKSLTIIRQVFWS